MSLHPCEGCARQLLIRAIKRPERDASPSIGLVSVHGAASPCLRRDRARWLQRSASSGEDYDVNFGMDDGELLVRTPKVGDFQRLYRYSTATRELIPITPEMNHDIA